MTRSYGLSGANDLITKIKSCIKMKRKGNNRGILLLKPNLDPWNKTLLHLITARGVYTSETTEELISFKISKNSLKTICEAIQHYGGFEALEDAIDEEESDIAIWELEAVLEKQKLDKRLFYDKTNGSFVTYDSLVDLIKDDYVENRETLDFWSSMNGEELGFWLKTIEGFQ